MNVVQLHFLLALLDFKLLVTLSVAQVNPVYLNYVYVTASAGQTLAAT